MWRPVPPKGYIAFGDIVVKGTAKPSITLDKCPAVCVNIDCVNQLQLGSNIWNVSDISRIDYMTEENYRIHNNISFDAKDDINNKDKDDNVSYPRDF